MGSVLSRAPVYFAATQVRHNPVPALNEKETRSVLRERLRKLGYTDQAEIRQQFVVEVGGNKIELQQPQTPLVCMTQDKHTAVFITEDRFWVQTTNYADFPWFKRAFIEALAIVDDVVELDYVDIVSMRMLDAIVPKEGEVLEQYLPESLLGLTAWAKDRCWELKHQAAEHVFQHGDHRITLRCVRQPNKIGFPPDFVPHGMALLQRHAVVDREHAVLDSDSAYEHRLSFDLDEIANHLDEVKGDLSTCFKTVVTNYALDQWA